VAGTTVRAQRPIGKLLNLGIFTTEEMIYTASVLNIIQKKELKM
jgi:hypothetical protein